MPVPVSPQQPLTAAGTAAGGGRAEARPDSRTEALGRYAVDRQVAGALRRAAGATGVGFSVLAAKAAMESGFRPEAQAASSSARGLFQFIDQTWLAVVREHGGAHGLTNEAEAIIRGPSGRLTVADPSLRQRILALRDDPQISALMGAEHLKDIGEALTPVLGRRPDAAELYLGHFLGTGGAAELLRKGASDPNMSASQVLPAAARANPAIFRGADGQPLSVSQLVGRIRERVGQTYAGLGMSMPEGPLDMVRAEPKGAKPGEAVASSDFGWWGSGPPARVAHMPERAMMSTLVEVFTRMGRSAAFRGGARGDTPQALPVAVLEALRQDQAGSRL